MGELVLPTARFERHRKTREKYCEMSFWYHPSKFFWFRVGHIGPGLELRFPGQYAIFSEREGIDRPIFKCFGYRLFLLKPVRTFFRNNLYSGGHDGR